MTRDRELLEAIHPCDRLSVWLAIAELFIRAHWRKLAMGLFFVAVFVVFWFDICAVMAQWPER